MSFVVLTEGADGSVSGPYPTRAAAKRAISDLAAEQATVCEVTPEEAAMLPLTPLGEGSALEPAVEEIE